MLATNVGAFISKEESMLVARTLSFLLFAFHSLNSFSSEQTSTEWTQLLAAHKLEASEQAYCYSDELGKMQGENLDLKVRLASVSKLVTSLWALEVLGADYIYETKLFIKGDQLHLKGSLDPFLGNEKMFFLLSQLNTLGIKNFEKITFDKIIQINPNAQVPADQYPLITRESNAKNIMSYFNTRLWSNEQKAEYQRLATKFPKKFKKEIEFTLARAEYVEKNPLENAPQVKILTLSSPPLFKYLKEINIESNNYAAQTIFNKIGGEKKFQDFMITHFGFSPESIRFFSGSGLPVITAGVRYDNYATCAVMLELITALKNVSEKQNRKIEEIMAVPGSDGGTFNNRTFPADYKNAFVAKTGTLMHTSTLAGVMSTKKGFSFYGIFNQSTDIAGSKLVQNDMVKSIMVEMGGPVAFAYTAEVFATYGTEDVKSRMSASEFSPFQRELY